MTEKKIEIPKDYDPLKDTGEYMNPIQLAFFKNMLEEQKMELLGFISPKIKFLSEVEISGDEGDVAQTELERGINLRITDRQSKLVKKIDEALLRIDSGDYGYCQANGDPIGVPRLLARPVTNYCIAEQNKRDSNEKIHESYQKTDSVLSQEYTDYELEDIE